MLLTIDAPDGLNVMFIGYVARDENGMLFMSQHCASAEEMKGEKTIELKKGIEDERIE